MNWNFHPDWIVSINKQWIQTDNDLAQFNFLNREDEAFETGIRYQNQIGTQFGLAYRQNDSSFLNRTGFILELFGEEATFKEYVEDAGIRYLKPLNPQYPTIKMDETMHICGVVVQATMEE